MKRNEMILKIAQARVEQCKKQNFEKFGNNDISRENEDINKWINHYKNYPMHSKKYPCFCLAYEYKRFYGGV